MGYIPENVRVISDRANRLKSNRTLTELRHRAEVGPESLRRDYRQLVFYLEREALLALARNNAAKGGKSRGDWQAVAGLLGRLCVHGIDLANAG
jgi:hypothetical protein